MSLSEIELISKLPLVLGSGSPRRRELLASIGAKFDVIVLQTDESFPGELDPAAVPLYLARKKAAAFADQVNKGQVILTADTVVINDHEILNKPGNEAECIQMLQSLSGKTHQVITGVCITSNKTTSEFAVGTDVTLSQLSADQIAYYVSNFNPTDKAGAYGIQEWIGHTCVTAINGSYNNVVGLPTAEVYHHLLKIATKWFL